MFLQVTVENENISVEMSNLEIKPQNDKGKDQQIWLHNYLKY